jgi:hypothetical protein
VLFKLKDPSPESIAATAEVLRSMDGRIATLRSVEVAVNEREAPNSYHIALRTTHDSWGDYETYRTDPYHVDTVLAHMGAAVEHSASVDFQSRAV